MPFAADGRGDNAGWGESFGFGTDTAFTVSKTREDICPQWSITHRARILALRSRPVLSLQMHKAEMVMYNPVFPPPCCLPCLHPPCLHCPWSCYSQIFECFPTFSSLLPSLFLLMDALGKLQGGAKGWSFTHLQSQPWRTPF